MRLGGISEVAEALGVTRQRLATLRARPDFPDPIGELAQGPVWDLEAIHAWNGSGLRHPSGRPTAETAARTLGERFVLREKIGRGGFAEVFRAADRKRGGKMVAVKVLHEVASIDPEAVRRFRRELRLMESLDHPHVIRILGHGETSGEGIWYAMPLAQGSLVDMMPEIAGKPTLILDVMKQVCSGLAYVHEQGLFHRDLKPGNILRKETGEWAIADFGLAAEAERKTTILTSTLRAGLGSFWYTAPEQWTAARKADHRSDIYSLGKVLQELATGLPPVSNEMPAGALRPVVERATASRPDDRHQSVTELLAATTGAIAAPKGRWETAQDTAERLLARIRVKRPATDDLGELLSWAQTLDEKDASEMGALASVLPWISSWSIAWLWSEDSGAFRRLFEHYSDHIAVGGFLFSDCDVLAEFSRCSVEETNDPGVIRSAAYSLAEMGYRHNRWHVRDVLTGMLQAIREDEPAAAAAEGLRAASRTAVEWSLTPFTRRSLHPTLRYAVSMHLDASE